MDQGTQDPIEGTANTLYDTIFAIVNDDFWSDVIMTVAVVLIAAIVCRLVVKLLRRFLSRDSSPLPHASIFVNLARVVIWSIAISVILSTCFGIDVSALIAALGIGGIAISLGFQDTLANVIGGLQLSIGGIVKPGDYIEINGIRGEVGDITWRHTEVLTTTGTRVVVPNSVINKDALVILPPRRKVVVPFSVTTDGRALDDVAARIRDAAVDAAKSAGELDAENAPGLVFSGITDYGFAGSVVVWMAADTDQVAAQDAIVRAIAPFTR